MAEELFDKNAARIDALERLFDQRFISSQEAIRAALTANDQRLTGMNEFRQSINDTTNKMMTRVEALTALEGASKKTDAEVEALRMRLEESSKPNYPFIIGILSCLATVCTAAWLIIGLKIEGTITPNLLSIVALQEHIRQQDEQVASITHASQASTLHDTVSGEDRAQLNAKVMSLEQRVAAGTSDRRSSETSVKERLSEIETQFCASDIVRNLMHANDLRMISMLWKKSYSDTALPTDNAYYPRVCNRAIN